MSEYIDVTNYGGERKKLLPKRQLLPKEHLRQKEPKQKLPERRFLNLQMRLPKRRIMPIIRLQRQRLPVRQKNLLRRMQVNRTKRKSRPEMKQKRTIRNRSWIIFLFTATKFWRALRRPEMS